MNFYICPDVTLDVRQKAGPIVGMRLLQKTLKEFLTSKNITNVCITNNISEIKNSIVWFWSIFSKKDDIDMLIKNNNKIICGPNTFFSRPTQMQPSETYVFECGKINEFFLHPHQYEDNEYVKNIKNVIHNFVYPVDIEKINEIQIDMKSNERDIDILLYCKFDFKENYKLLLERYNSKYKIVSLEYGHYDKDELIKLAFSSKCCIYLSTGETGGIACCEILCCGCPIISHKSNLNLADDNVHCFKLGGNQDFYWYEKKTDDMIKTAMDMDKHKLMQDAQEKFSPNNIVSSLLTTINEIIQTTKTKLE